MANKDYWKIKYRIEKQKEYCKKVFSYCNLDDEPGIYFFYRTDENGNKKGYVGQAKKLLTRVNEHVNSTRFSQHIDRSLKAHSVSTKKNLGGYRLRVYRCKIEELDEKEKFYIQFYLDHNYTLLNVESGGQDKGHTDLNYRTAAKGYRDGIKQGYTNAIREIADILSYLKVEPNQFKKNGEPTEIAKRKLNELKEKLTNGQKETIESDGNGQKTA